jgi:hypothetical protein
MGRASRSKLPVATSQSGVLRSVLTSKAKQSNPPSSFIAFYHWINQSTNQLLKLNALHGIVPDAAVVSDKPTACGGLLYCRHPRAPRERPFERGDVVGTCSCSPANVAACILMGRICSLFVTRTLLAGRYWWRTRRFTARYAQRTAAWYHQQAGSCRRLLPVEQRNPWYIFRTISGTHEMPITS